MLFDAGQADQTMKNQSTFELMQSVDGSASATAQHQNSQSFDNVDFDHQDSLGFSTSMNSTTSSALQRAEGEKSKQGLAAT